MPKVICPCKDCTPPKRCTGCHSSCKEYLAWQRKYIRAKYYINEKKSQEGWLAKKNG